MIRYKYNGVEYPSLRVLRQAVWENERKAYGEFSTKDQFAAVGIAVEFLEYPDPEVPEAVLATRVREKRDRMLAESDFFVMSDYPSTEEGLTEVKTYRQALRDVPNQEGFPHSVVWPVKPEVLGGVVRA